MKNFILFSLLLSLLGYSKVTLSQNAEKADSLGLPGDNLNLYVVLQLFQESKTLDEFEKKLNEESRNVNNLDLNNDDKIDYIKVIDNTTNGAHAIVLQTPVNEKETQDIAVIEVEKDKAGNTVVQIVGNEELYGKDYIIEPKENDSSAIIKKSDTTISSDGKTVIINNNTTNNYNTATPQTDESPKVYVSINQWPLIQYMYAPGYVVYSSPWYWSYYPGWWNPWTPWYWNRYYNYHYYHHHNHYYGYYHRTNMYRNNNANTYYGPRRTTSSYVQRNRNEGRYNNTYKREPNKVENVRPARPNPGYKDPASAPTRDVRPINPSNPGVRPTTNPIVNPNPRINRPIQQQPQPNRPIVNPRNNNPTQQQPRQNRPSRPSSQNKGTERRR